MENQEQNQVEQPIGFAADDKYVYQFTPIEFKMLQQALAPFKWALSVINMKEQQAVAEGGVVPLFEKDKVYLIDEGNGQLRVSDKFWEDRKQPKQEVETVNN